MAMMLKFIDRCQQIAQAKCNNLTANEISSAEKRLLLLVQKKYFKEELTTYHPGSKPKTNKGRRNFGNLWKLDPYVDTDGLLRVGGRLSKSSFGIAQSNPVILPKDCVIS